MFIDGLPTWLPGTSATSMKQCWHVFRGLRLRLRSSKSRRTSPQFTTRTSWWAGATSRQTVSVPRKDVDTLWYVESVFLHGYIIIVIIYVYPTSLPHDQSMFLWLGHSHLEHSWKHLWKNNTGLEWPQSCMQSQYLKIHLRCNAMQCNVSMYVCLTVCMYVHICICVNISVCICIGINVYHYECIYIYTVGICVDMCICMYI